MIKDPAEYTGYLVDDKSLVDLETVSRDERYESVLNGEQYIKIYEATSSGKKLGSKQNILRIDINNTNDLLDLEHTYLVFRQKYFEKGKPLGTEGGNNWNAGNKDTRAHAFTFVNGVEKMIRRLSLLADGLTVDVYNNDFHMLSLLEDMIHNEADELRHHIPETYKYNGGRYIVGNDNAIGGYCASATANTIVDLRGTVLYGNTPYMNRRLLKSYRTIVDGRVYEVESMIRLSKLCAFFKNYKHVSTKINYQLEIELHTETNGRHFLQQEGAFLNFADVPDANGADWDWVDNMPVYLLCRRVLPSGEKYAKIRQDLVNGITNNFVYNDNMIFRQPFLAGSTSEVWRITNSLSRLLKVYAFFQHSNKQDANTDTAVVRKLNEKKLDECGIDNIQLKVGGIPYPTERYNVNFGKGGELKTERLRAYHDFVKNTGSDILFDDWLNNVVYCFNVNVADNEAGTNEIVLEFERSGDANAFNGYVVVEYLKECEVSMNTTGGSVRVIGSS